MQHEQGTEKKPLKLGDVPEISRTRLILLILNAICIGCAMTIAITAAFELTDENFQEQMITIKAAILVIVFYSFGFIVTYKYFHAGLCVFAWFTAVSIYAVVVMYVRLFSDRLQVRDKKSFAIQLFAFFDVMVIIFRFSGKLILLLNANEHLIP